MLCPHAAFPSPSTSELYPGTSQRSTETLKLQQKSVMDQQMPPTTSFFVEQIIQSSHCTSRSSQFLIRLQNQLPGHRDNVYQIFLGQYRGGLGYDSHGALSQLLGLQKASKHSITFLLRTLKIICLNACTHTLNLYMYFKTMKIHRFVAYFMILKSDFFQIIKSPIHQSQFL